MINLIKKFFAISWAEVAPLIIQSKKVSKRSYLDLIRDLVACQRQWYSWSDYFAFDFANNQSEDYRQSFISVGRHYPIIAQYCKSTSSDVSFFNDKGSFHKHFKQFKPIDTLDLRTDDIEQLEQFFSKHQEAFVKSPSSVGGKGVKYLSPAFLQTKTISELHSRLLDNGFTIVEEKIVQHHLVNQLSTNAINSVRIVTCKHTDGTISAPFAASRISITDAHVDNASSGGAYTALDNEWKVSNPYQSRLPTIEFHNKHPLTGFDFLWFQFPYFKEATNMCISAAQQCTNCLIWRDVAVSESGPILIEANIAPWSELIQSCKDGKGKIDELEQALGISLR